MLADSLVVGCDKVMSWKFNPHLSRGRQRTTCHLDEPPPAASVGSAARAEWSPPVASLGAHSSGRGVRSQCRGVVTTFCLRGVRSQSQEGAQVLGVSHTEPPG